jgi:hypothetical protein
MQHSLDETMVYLGTSKPEAEFTAAVTDIITSAAHALANGDLLQFTTETTLPAGLSLATNYYVIDITTNTFKIFTPNSNVTTIINNSIKKQKQ